MPSNYFENYGIVTVTAATVSITDEAHVGQRVIFNRAAGVTATLPEATGSGNRYEFIGLVDASGSQIIKVGDNTDIMMGVAYLATTVQVPRASTLPTPRTRSRWTDQPKAA